VCIALKKLFREQEPDGGAPLRDNGNKPRMTNRLSRGWRDRLDLHVRLVGIPLFP